MWKRWADIKIKAALWLLRKEVPQMAIAIVYATLIMNGRRQFKDVPAVIKDDVRAVLTDLGLEALAE